MIRGIAFIAFFIGSTPCLWAQEQNCGPELTTLFQKLHIQQPPEHFVEQFPDVMKITINDLRIKHRAISESAKQIEAYDSQIDLEKRSSLINPNGRFTYDSVRRYTLSDSRVLMTYYSGRRAIGFMVVEHKDKSLPADVQVVRLLPNCRAKSIFGSRYPSTYFLDREHCQSSAFEHPEQLPTTTDYFDSERMCERVGGTVRAEGNGSLRHFSCMCQKPGEMESKPMKYVLDPCTQERIEAKVQLELSKTGVYYFHTATREAFTEAKAHCLAAFGTTEAGSTKTTNRAVQ